MAGAEPGGRGRLRPLARRALPVDAVALGRFLIGQYLVRDHADGRVSGRIVETEAYLVGDAAAHAFRGETPRNRSLFLERGHAYVYFIYGCWYAVNVSAETRGVGAGVLVRALVPHEGIALMERRRSSRVLRDLARGPGRLASALAIDRTLDGTDLCAPGPLWLATDGAPRASIGVTTRIGLSKEAHRPLRFYSRAPADLPFVSGPRGALGA
ncbi:MAG TPA: DNA-3-methyladenine glycosylase [Casimicrobiaceae bacterium]|nr:DNA-3-methyladenine glycosylase [Casimicrobiaceae bacterium]